MSRMLRFAALFPLLVPFPAGAAVTCADVLKVLGSSLADVNCFASPDLTTTNTTNDIRRRRHRQQFAARAASVRLHAYHRSQRDRAERRQAHADHKGRAGPAAQRPHRLRPAGPGAVPSAAAEQLERAPGGRGRVGNAQRVQRRFRVERLRRAEGLRLRVAEQGRVELAALDAAADPLACRLNPASTTFVHFYDNDPGQPFTRWAEFMVKAAELARDGVKAGYGRSPALHLRGGDLERRLPGAPRGRDRAEALRRRRRLGRHLRRRARAEHPHRPAAGDPEFPATTRGLGLQRREHRGEEHPGRGLSARHRRRARRHRCGVFTTRQFWEVTQCQWQKRLDPDLRHLREAEPARTTT